MVVRRKVKVVETLKMDPAYVRRHLMFMFWDKKNVEYFLKKQK